MEMRLEFMKGPILPGDNERTQNMQLIYQRNGRRQLRAEDGSVRIEPEMVRGEEER